MYTERDNLPTPPYTKTEIIDGREVTITVLPPGPEMHDERTWPVPKPNVQRPPTRHIPTNDPSIDMERLSRQFAL